MSASSPMKPLGRWFGYDWWWAGNRFVEPGLYYWNGKDNVRLVPWPKRRST